MSVTLTPYGRLAVNAAATGQTVITFTSMKTTDSTLMHSSISPDGMIWEDFNSEKQTVSPSSVTLDRTTLTAVVSGTFTNENLAAAYDIVGVGLYATCAGDFSRNTPELFAYEFFSNSPDHMPLVTDFPTAFTYMINSTVSDASAINMTIEQGVYASAADLQSVINRVHTNEANAITVRLNNVSESSERTGYNWLQEVTVQGMTEDYLASATISSGTYVNTFAVETAEDKLRLWFTVKPANSVYLKIVYYPTYS